MRAHQRVPQLTHGHRGGRTWSAGAAIDTPTALELLRHGDLVIEGRVRDASNVVLWCAITGPATVPVTSDAMAGSDQGRTMGEEGPGDLAPAVPAFHVAYKPIRGERPLDDFAEGTLALREEAAWWVSEALGWSVVPPTIVRDGPAGRGAVQLWIETDDTVDLLRMILVRDERLRPMAVFDALVNNADRKGGHLLVTEEGAVHGIDHGICFATEPKLRTVLWGWRGEPLTDEERTDIGRVRDALREELGERLSSLLSEREVEALRARAGSLLATGRLPLPDPHRHVIPWPPF